MDYNYNQNWSLVFLWSLCRRHTVTIDWLLWTVLLWISSSNLSLTLVKTVQYHSLTGFTSTYLLSRPKSPLSLKAMALYQNHNINILMNMLPCKNTDNIIEEMRCIGKFLPKLSCLWKEIYSECIPFGSLYFKGKAKIIKVKHDL